MSSETLLDVNPGRMFVMTDKASPDEPTFKKCKKIQFGKIRCS